MAAQKKPFQPYRTDCIPKAATLVYAGPKTSLYAEELSTSLLVPWDLSWGPDGALWVSEMHGRISRLNGSGAMRETMAEVPVDGLPWSGLMGLGFDSSGEVPVLYAAASSATFDGMLRTRLLAFPLLKDGLGESVTVLDGIPGGGNHNGGRIEVQADGSVLLATGDGGRPTLASDPGSLAGKILRLVPTAQVGEFDIEVVSIGHRNPQGLATSPWNGAVYASEHGATVDEVNLIESGADYGWPRYEGGCLHGDLDGRCYDDGAREALVVFAPAIGASGLAIYASHAVPSWGGDVLVVGLRGERLVRIGSQNPEVDVEVLVKGAFGRLRDVAVGEDGAIYVATSNRDAIAAIDGVRVGQRDDRIIRLTPCRGLRPRPGGHRSTGPVHGANPRLLRRGKH